jgi:photosystem II stability/assembly factor-like uncharacterized protein
MAPSPVDGLLIDSDIRRSIGAERHDFTARAGHVAPRADQPTMGENSGLRNSICLSTNGKTASSSKEPPAQLLVATTDGVKVFARPDPDSPWKLGGHVLPGEHVSSLLHEPQSGLLVAGLHYQGGIKLSTDDGRTWAASTDGLRSEHVYSLAVQYVGGQPILFAGTEPAVVYRSDDLGRSWRSLSPLSQVPESDKWWFPHATPHVKNIAFHPSAPDTIYVCVEQGDLLKTTDGGRSWRQLTSYEKPGDKFRRDMHRVTICPSDPNELFLTSGTGLYHSGDGGETWVHLTDPDFRVGYPDPFYLHPADENIAFMVGAGQSPNPNWGATGSANPGFLRSADRGRTWEERMGGMPHPVRGNMEAAAMHDSGSMLEFFVGTACGELYTSRDEGGSWEVISTDLPPVSKGPHFRHFLAPAERAAVEEKLRAINAFA